MGLSQEAHLRERIEDLRAQGEPVWFADLEPAPVPEADNGAKDYYHAMQFRVIREKTGVRFGVSEPSGDGPVDIAQPETTSWVEFKAAPNNPTPNSGAAVPATDNAR